MAPTVGPRSDGERPTAPREEPPGRCREFRAGGRMPRCSEASRSSGQRRASADRLRLGEGARAIGGDDPDVGGRGGRERPSKRLHRLVRGIHPPGPQDRLRSLRGAWQRPIRGGRVHGAAGGADRAAGSAQSRRASGPGRGPCADRTSASTERVHGPRRLPADAVPRRQRPPPRSQPRPLGVERESGRQDAGAVRAAERRPGLVRLGELGVELGGRQRSSPGRVGRVDDVEDDLTAVAVEPHADQLVRTMRT